MKNKIKNINTRRMLLLVIMSVLFIVALSIVACGEDSRILSVSLVDGTYKVDYTVGETPTLAGAELKVKYSNGDEQIAKVTKEMVRSQELEDLVYASDDDLYIDDSGSKFVKVPQDLTITYQGFDVVASIHRATNRYITIDNTGWVSGGNGIVEYEIIEVPENINGMDIIGIRAYAFYKSPLGGISIPHSLIVVDIGAFEEASRLSSVEFRKDENDSTALQLVNIRAFGYCTSLVTVTLPKELKSMNAEAFVGSSNLQSILIEKSPTYSSAYFTPDNAYNGAVYKTAEVSNPNDCKYENAYIWPDAKGYSSVYFDPNNGDDIITISAPPTAQIQAPFVYKQNYLLDGWYNDNDDKIDSNNIIVQDAPYTLTAHWEIDDSRTYTIIYDSNIPTNASQNIQGSMQANQGLFYDETYHLAQNNYSLGGWEFLGWSVTPNGTVEYLDKDAITIQEPTNSTGSGLVLLYAVWRANEYIIVYDDNHPSNASSIITGSMENTTATFDTATPLSLNQYSLIGYNFIGWAESPTGGTIYMDGAEIKTPSPIPNNNEKHILYAVWQAKQYTIIYNITTPNNASNSITGSTSSSIHTYDSPRNLTTNGYSLYGWSFAGWATSPNGSVVYEDKASVLNLVTGGVVELYTVWVANEYTITLDTMGGESISTTIIVQFDDDYVLAIPTKTGYRFVGWYELPNGSGLQYTNHLGQSLLPWAETQDKTVYAHYIAEQYFVSFDIKGGIGQPSDILVTYDNIFGTLPNDNDLVTTKIGYKFVGWFIDLSDPNSQIRSTDIVQITKDTTVYANWVAIRYNIAYNDNIGGEVDGTMPNDINISYDRGHKLQKNVYHYIGYNFLGWSFVQGDNANSINFADEEIISNLTEQDNATITLYAVWQAKTYTITYNFIDREIDSDPSHYNMPSGYDTPTYGEPYKMAEPTLMGMSFEGWYLDTQYTQKFAYGTKDIVGNDLLNIGELVSGRYLDDSDITVYAKWEVVKYRVIDDLGASILEFDTTQYLSSLTISGETEKFRDFGYVFKDITLKGNPLGNSSDPNNTTQTRTITSINKGSYILGLYNRLTKVENGVGVLENGGTLNHYGIETIVTSSLTSIPHDNGVAILNFSSWNGSNLGYGYKIASNITHITFKGVISKIFTNFNIIVDTRSAQLTIGFENFKFIAPSGQDETSGVKGTNGIVGISIESDISTIIQYKGTNSITGSKGGVGKIGNNGLQPDTILGTGTKGSDGEENTIYEDRADASDGGNGAKGTNASDNSVSGKGGNGYSGGNAIDSYKAPTFVCVDNGILSLQGGDGGQGGTGGTGGKGGKGQQGGEGGTAGYYNSVWFWVGPGVGRAGKGGNGGTGGAGGKGGTGGNGGDGGYTITHKIGTLNTNISGLQLIPSKGGIEGQGGDAGASGDGGEAGIGGLKARIEKNGLQFTVYWDIGRQDGSTKGSQGQPGVKGSSGIAGNSNTL